MLRLLGTKFQFNILRRSVPNSLFLFSAVCCLYIIYYQLKYSTNNEVKQNAEMQGKQGGSYTGPQNDTMKMYNTTTQMNIIGGNVTRTQDDTTTEGIDRKRLLLVQNLINGDDNKLVCKQPVVPIDSPEIMQYMKSVDDINCVQPSFSDFVTCQFSTCKIKKSVKLKMRDAKCKFSDVIRVDDYNVRSSNSVTTAIYPLVNSDAVIVECTSLFKNWSSVKTAIRLDPSIWTRTGWEFTPPDGLKMNVFLFAIDSLSRNMFIRKLPLTYKYLIEGLGAHVLQSYNVVGDGTLHQITPLLTGKMEIELPEVRLSSSKGQNVDVYPFIWKNYSANGYVTAFLEDSVVRGTYNYRLRGFKEQPTDHFMKPFYTATKNYSSEWKPYCDGDVPRHVTLLRQIKHFFAVYKSKPKFIFSFLSELSHDDYNLVAASDKDIVDCIKHLFSENALNNTILIVMADHGHRFGAIRNTLQGKLEERLPFFSVTFPPWFKIVHKEMYENFLSNIHTLTTPFDIHATLSNILHTSDSNATILQGRSMSLFSSIPKNRTCADAYVGPHWCACSVWDTVNITDAIVPFLVQTFENTVNNFTKPLRHICSYLTVSHIMNVTKLRANDKLLKFREGIGLDVIVPDLTGSTKILTDMYQLKVQTIPGGGIYETAISYSHITNLTSLKLTDVSRVNKYSTQARCVEYKHPEWRKYCYCTRD